MNRDNAIGALVMLLLLVSLLSCIVLGYNIPQQQHKETTKEYYPAPFDIKVNKEDSGDIMINGVMHDNR